MKLWSCVSLLLGYALAASAATASSKPDESFALEPAAIAAKKTDLLKGIEDGKRYRELTRTQREQVLAALDRLAIAVGTPEAQRDAGAREQIAADHELVQRVLSQAAYDSRLKCRREKIIGSNRTQATCHTLGELRRERERTQREYDRRPRSEVGQSRE
jgi:hypothetical protein